MATPTKALISYTDYVSASATTLTTNSAVAGLGVERLASYPVCEFWRSDTGTGRRVDVDLGSALPVNVVCFAMPRSEPQLADGDGITLALDATTAGAGALLSTAMTDCDYGYWLWWSATAIDARYARLTFSTSIANIAGGRLWIGPGRIMDRNFGYDWSREWADDGTVTRSKKSGRLFRDYGARYRNVSIAFGAATTADADAIEAGDLLVGTTGQMLICTHPDTPQRRTLLGVPAQVEPITQRSFSLFAKTYSITEEG